MLSDIDWNCTSEQGDAGIGGSGEEYGGVTTATDASQVMKNWSEGLHKTARLLKNGGL
jgi:hypothetical protein